MRAEVLNSAIDIGTVERQSAEVIPLSIEVTSTSPEVAELSRRAFASHGGYRLAAHKEAELILHFRPSGASSITLFIEPLVSGETSFEGRFTGSTWQEATLKACDAAVQHTLALPGIFGGKLAFTSNRTGFREIYTSDLFFQNVCMRTQDKSKSVAPHWAPNGEKILYTGYFQSGFPDVFLLDLKTGQRTVFAAYRGTNTGGTFSPDGKKVALVLSSSGSAELYVSNDFGNQLRRLTRNKSLEATPTWSPDGTTIVLTSDLAGGPQLYTIPAQGGKLQRIPTNISGYCSEPSWNPRDPSLLAFTAATGGGFQVTLYDFKTKKSRFLTQGPEDCIEPCWLKDGRHLLFTQRTTTQEQLWLLDTETGHKSPLHSRSFGNASGATYIYP